MPRGGTAAVCPGLVNDDTAGAEQAAALFHDAELRGVTDWTTIATR